MDYKNSHQMDLKKSFNEKLNKSPEEKWKSDESATIDQMPS